MSSLHQLSGSEEMTKICTSISPHNSPNDDRKKKNVTQVQGLKASIFPITVGTRRVSMKFRDFGGKSPHSGLNLEDFLQAEGSSDIYVIGFQEIVPLNAGNVLVIEDNEPALKWLTLISQALNRPSDEIRDDDNTCSTSESNINSKETRHHSGVLFFQRPSLKVLSKNFAVDNGLVKSCNCYSESVWQRRRTIREVIQGPDSIDDDDTTSELVPHVGHVRVSTVGRGIMGCLGNKGCISMSMTLHRTSFCFVCSHLASGEKEGDELKRNADVAEILKSTQFPRICKTTRYRIPERILEHDQVIWLGDLNYRIALTYAETRVLLEDNDWDSLLEKDQLIIEREAGRVFKGWNEGKIFFAPTYKYSHNSDSYAGETVKSKKKRRTPAWCDRILWYGGGIEQLSYIRGESRFSDHRPVCSVFMSEVELQSSSSRGREAISSPGAGIQECIPQRHSLYEF
ncbi:type I inositol polyphosphate 5-phosphatase 5 [Cinnamomum micranthum f. kanehirae]|uniref:Type I inositol polyphosphate 5-phosphatase 5 n=1 Tax=Cinnamomum micranthum f. kanehirae TaxID=337451 RepID=A0A3S3NDL5_9MAGN|nr:type I inositol polyphosphate 5-phosphatase 5 [Cinnamomum micranthum f. kanehirae]